MRPGKYKVNVLHRGKEKWRYPLTLKKAKFFQEMAIDGGLSSIIYEKIDGKYLPISNK